MLIKQFKSQLQRWLFLLTTFFKPITLILLLLPLQAFGNSKKHIQKSKITVAAERTKAYLFLLENKRVALVANHTSMVKKQHLLDTLLKLNINVVKIFTPEHGFRGNVAAGEEIATDIDEKTGLPIISLYGKNKRPSDEQMQDIDIIIFDIQDVGVRFYTYISTMSYMMEAAAKNNIPMIILDRPNPNGFYIDGPILKPENKSFVGLHPVPIVYGMTIGEYARMVNCEGWLANSLECDLIVIPCSNYNHQKKYKLPIPPSPALKSMQAIYLYPSLCLFEGTIVSVGRGTKYPFEQIGHPKYKPYSKYYFIPKKNKKNQAPILVGKKCYGYNLRKYPIEKLNGIKLDWLKNFYDKIGKNNDFFNPLFNKLTGDTLIKHHILQGNDVQLIKESWQGELKHFKNTREKYLLYE